MAGRRRETWGTRFKFSLVRRRQYVIVLIDHRRDGSPKLPFIGWELSYWSQ